jgi:hypothetical protein
LRGRAFARNFLDVPGRDRNRAARRHRVARIHAQVHDGQFQFARVDLDVPKPGIAVDLHVDVAAQGALQHLAHGVEVRGDVDGLGIHRATSRECKQVTRKAGAAGDGASHGIENDFALLLRRVALQDMHAAREHREQVVEVVRDAAGELSE